MSRYRAVLVALRSFLGIVYLTNGLAKVFSFHSVTIGPWKSYLIDRSDALGILRSNSKGRPHSCTTWPTWSSVTGASCNGCSRWVSWPWASA